MRWGPTILFSMCIVSTIMYTIYFISLPIEMRLTTNQRNHINLPVQLTTKKPEQNTTLIKNISTKIVQNQTKSKTVTAIPEKTTLSTQRQTRSLIVTGKWENPISSTDFVSTKIYQNKPKSTTVTARLKETTLSNQRQTRLSIVRGKSGKSIFIFTKINQTQTKSPTVTANPKETTLSTQRQTRSSIMTGKSGKPTLSAEFNRSIDALWENGLHKMRAIYTPGYVIIPNNSICPDFGIDRKIVIIVTSAPKNFQKRQVIRETWANFDKENATIAFILGTTSEANITEKVKREAIINNDLIVGNFHDSYSNLTLKSLSMLEWMNKFCKDAEYLFKTDDDMFINVKKLLSFAETRNSSQRVIYGRIGRGWKPNRDHSSKYYISRKQFRRNMFPDFITGPAYLLSTRLCKPLYLKALTLRFVKLEDVFITGIVAQALKIERQGHKVFLNRRAGFGTCNLRRYVSFHEMRITEQRRYWKKINNPRMKC